MNPRPKQTDEAILTAAMTELYTKKIKAWLIEADGGQNPNDEDVIKDLVRAYDADGYDFAKDLDQQGWMPDADLVDLLTEAYYIVTEQHQKALETWVRDCAVEITPFSVGMKAQVVRDWHPINKRDVVITSVKPKTLEYTVCLEADYKPGKTGGYIVNHEELIFAPETIVT